MSTNKPPGSGANKPPDSSSGANKKGKSKGFIESSGFKPGWLETGPLPPLPPPPASATPEDSQSVAEELAALQEALQRYYGTPAADDELLPAAPEDPVVAAAEAPAAPEPLAVATDHPELEALSVAPEDTSPAADEPPTMPDPALAPPAWILAIGQPAEAAPPAPEITTATPTAFEMDAPLPDREPLPDSPPPAEVATPELASTFAEPPVEDDGVTVMAAADEPPPTADAPDTAAAPVAPTAKRQRRGRRERQTARPIRRRSRLSTALLTISLLLLAAAAVIYFVNPFTRLALGLASLARPVAPPGVTPPGAAENNWCLQGSFPTGDALPQLQDGGAQGDLVANDRVFSLEYTVPRPGNYRWQIVACDDTTRRFPAAMAWLTTHEANQLVTFIFDSNERDDRLFFPIPYVVSAVDGVEEYHVIGSFQDWIANDASGRLEPLSSGLYQQVRRIARSGSYEAYVIAGNEEQAIDAYGRTTEPIPFAFDTEQNGEYVVFLVDVDRGRASVMYDMPPLVTRLAFGGGHQLLSLALVGLAGLLLLFLLLRRSRRRGGRGR